MCCSPWGGKEWIRLSDWTVLILLDKDTALYKRILLSAYTVSRKITLCFAKDYNQASISALLSCGASLVTQMVKNLFAIQDIQAWSLAQEDPMEKRMTTHSSILAWRIPWTEKPGRLQSMGSQRVRHDWASNTSWCSSNVLSDCLFQNGMQFKQRIHGHRRIPTSS